jgi:hypothetical protein
MFSTFIWRYTPNSSINKKITTNICIFYDIFFELESLMKQGWYNNTRKRGDKSSIEANYQGISDQGDMVNNKKRMKRPIERK